MPGAAWNAVYPVQDQQWDRKLSKFGEVGVFHGSDWAEVLVQSYGHRPAYLVLPSVEGGFDAVLPLMEIGGSIRGRAGVSLPFTDVCPPLLNEKVVDLEALVAAAFELAKSRRWKTIEFRSDRELPFSGPSIRYLAHRLDLTAGPEQLFARCDPAVRRAVRRSRKDGVVVEVLNGVEAVRIFYQLYCLNRKRHGLPPAPWPFFCTLAERCLDGRSGFVTCARLGPVPIAAAVFLNLGRSAVYKYGASNYAFQHLRGNNLVMWESIRWLAESGVTTLDFGRTSLGDEGLRRFKLGWGTSESSLCYYRIRVSDGTVLPLADRSRGWHTKVFRRLPVAALKQVGRLIYRYQS